MTAEERVKSLFAGVNPVPNSGLVAPERADGTAYLNDLDTRSSGMTQLETKPTEKKEPKRGAWLLVALALAAAFAIGAVVILTQGEETPSVATQTTLAAVETPTTVATAETPTTVADAIDPRVEEGADIAARFVEALIIGDLATAETYAGSGTVELALLDGGSNPSAGPAGEVPWKDAMGWEATFEGCTVMSSNESGTRVQCSVSNSTAISRALGLEPFTSLHDYTVMYEGGTYFGQSIPATSIVADAGDGDQWQKIGYEEFKAGAFDPFMNWLRENHRDDLEQVMLQGFSIGVFSPDRWLTGDHAPNHSPESVELWQLYNEEFLTLLGD